MKSFQINTHITDELICSNNILKINTVKDEHIKTQHLESRLFFQQTETFSPS